MSLSLWYGADQFDFLFKIELYSVERSKYSGNNAANFTVYICLLFIL